MTLFGDYSIASCSPAERDGTDDREHVLTSRATRRAMERLSSMEAER